MNDSHDHEQAPEAPTKDEITKIRAELRKEVNELMDVGCWAVASLTGMRYLGRIAKIYYQDGSQENPSKEEILSHMQLWMCMNPVFDYLTQLIPNDVHPELPSKRPIILPIDMTTAITPQYLYCPHLLFLEDVQEKDLELYKNLVSNGLVTTRQTTLVQDPSGQGNTPQRGGPRIITPEAAARELARAGVTPTGKPMRR